MRRRDRGKVRIGVIGTGAICQLMHLPILTERRDVEVAAVADLDDLKARNVASRFGVGRVLDDDALVADDEIQGVVISAPSFVHESLARACLEAGKHVMVERPLALSAGGVRWIMKAAEEAGRGVILGMAHRYQPNVRAFRTAIADGVLGELSSVQVTWLNRAVRRPRGGWRRRALESGGGALMDLGVPALDLALWTMGYPEVARVSAVTPGDGFDVEEEAHVYAVTRDGVALSLAASWRLHAPDDRHQLEALGSEGSAVLLPLSIHREEAGRTVDVTPRYPAPRGGETLFTNGFRRLLDHFVAVVAGRTEAQPPAEQTALMDLVEAAYESAREGREVELSS